jgi:DNA-binding transcriptional LysR family regulator
MNLRQLEYFVAIAEQGSLTQAAERLLVSQPSLSQQIRGLEAELGGALLERLPRGVRLTTAGQELLGEARATLAHAQHARRAVRQALDLEVGQLEVAVTSSAALGILPAVLREWQSRHPSLEVSLLEFPHRRALEEAARDGAGDIAVGSQPETWRGPVQQLGWEELVLVLPDGDPLLDLEAVNLELLADRRWVHYARSAGSSTSAVPRPVSPRGSPFALVKWLPRHRSRPPGSVPRSFPSTSCRRRWDGSSVPRHRARSGRSARLFVTSGHR